MKKYNLKQLVSIEIFDKSEDKEYKYLPYKESKLPIGGGTFIEKEGIYKAPNRLNFYNFVCSEYSDNAFFDDHMIGDNKVIYLKPRVIFSFPNDERPTIYFNSFKEAKCYFNKVEVDNFKWLYFNNGEVHQTN